jgi:hypothetical protein
MIKYEKIYFTFNMYFCQTYIFKNIIRLSVEINNIIITLVIKSRLT